MKTTESTPQAERTIFSKTVRKIGGLTFGPGLRNRPETNRGGTDMVVSPLLPDYATQPIEDGFNWSKIITEVAEAHPDIIGSELYLMAFRSKRKPGLNAHMGRKVARYDKSAHEAAKESPALLYYFGGIVDENGNAMSFCLWKGREGALKGINHKDHTKAAGLAPDIYEWFNIERYSVAVQHAPTVEAGAAGYMLEFSEYTPPTAAVAGRTLAIS